MAPCFDSNAASDHRSKQLPHRWLRGRHASLCDHIPVFIQHAVSAGSVSQVHSDGTLLRSRRHLALHFRSANLFHSRSPFRAPPVRLSWGAYRIPLETGLLIPSIIGMYGPPQNCKRKIEMTVWSAPMYSAFRGVQDSWP